MGFCYHITIMKLITHRGWSTGPIENTITAFKKSDEADHVDGVELDVRFALGSDEVIVSHLPASAENKLSLDDALNYLAKTNLEIYIDIKQTNPELSNIVSKKLRQRGIHDRAHLFGLKHFARHLSFSHISHRVGMILLNPFSIHKNIKRFSPNLIMLCFSLNKWTWKLFWWYWTPEKLEKMIEQYPDINFIFGVDDHHNDAVKIKRIPGLYGLTTNRPEIWTE